MVHLMPKENRAPPAVRQREPHRCRQTEHVRAPEIEYGDQSCQGAAWSAVPNPAGGSADRPTPLRSFAVDVVLGDGERPEPGGMSPVMTPHPWFGRVAGRSSTGGWRGSYEHLRRTLPH
jgi:hypothetical protein